MPLDRRQYPHVATTDVRTACARALADHLRTIEFGVYHTTTEQDPHAPARATKFVKVFHEWPAPEKQLPVPSASVAVGNAVFEPSGMSPREVPGSRYPEEGPGWYLIHVDEAVIPMQLDVWAKDKKERQVICERLADLFTGQDGSGGITLDLGDYYYGQTAQYTLPRGYEIVDDSESAQRNERRAIFPLTVNCAVVAMREATDLNISVQTDDIGPDIEITAEVTTLEGE
jgi:hypothetical protein